MDSIKLKQNEFENALNSLIDSLNQPKDDYIRDSAILRYTYAFDSGWKALKIYLQEDRDIIVNSPKETFKSAFKVGFIPYNNVYIDMVDLRDEIVHTYNNKADDIYSKLPNISEALVLLNNKLKEFINNPE